MTALLDPSRPPSALARAVRTAAHVAGLPQGEGPARSTLVSAAEHPLVQLPSQPSPEPAGAGAADAQDPFAGLDFSLPEFTPPPDFSL